MCSDTLEKPALMCERCESESAGENTLEEESESVKLARGLIYLYGKRALGL